MEVRSDRVYRLSIPRDELWLRIAVVGNYSTWWPWLRKFEASALATGEVWHGTLQPPVPYAIHCDVRFETVIEAKLIAALVTGDIAGPARIELRDETSGTQVRVVSQLQARSRSIRIVARVMPWLARRAHDWVLDTAALQFAANAGLPNDPVASPFWRSPSGRWPAVTRPTSPPTSGMGPIGVSSNRSSST